jgi:tartrate dehydratase alpha subunit/fumarate hydratase class I-like protein
MARDTIDAGGRSSAADARIAAVTTIAASTPIAAVTDGKTARHTGDAHIAILPITAIAAGSADTLRARA